MLSAGVIEHGDGAWGFPVVLVKKKDGSVRFCVDYRSLNAVTRKDVYPLPRIDETLESLGGAQLFSTLDLRSGYWQIRVAEEDRDKTAFTTKRGLYRFKRMPFGLCNAPATFQRLMNGRDTWWNWRVYLNDYVELGLKLKKCTFLTNSMEYLGHHLSDQGVQPAERLVKSVREFPRPADAHEVKRFVHLAGYYRKFIAAFGSIVEPLTRLLKKDMVWQWTEAQEFAFEHVKMLLTTRPLLLYPNFKLSFRLVTDASKIGLGACLMQDHGHGWQPIAFGSKVNSKAEANYSITELECLAVVWAVKTFRPYLYGRAFTLITDHSALKWLMTRTNLAGRLHRWSLVLQEYEFQVEYRPGATNVVADALSRAPAAVRMVVGRQYQLVPKPIDATRAVTPATRRSARIQERDKHVHWATTLPDMNNATDGVARPVTTTTAAEEPMETGLTPPVDASVSVPRTDATLRATTTPEVMDITTPAPQNAGSRVQSVEPEQVTKRRLQKPTTRVVTKAKAPLHVPAVTTKKSVAPDLMNAGVTNGGVAATANDEVANDVATDDDEARGVDKVDDDDEQVPVEDFTLQLSDDDIVAAQKSSKFTKRLMIAGKYGSMRVKSEYGLVVIETSNGWRVVLPPTLWAPVFKEMHGSVWSGHLRGPHTYGRVAQLYWWPGLSREVRRWVRGCQECGSRKAKPREVIPPLRSLRGGAVGDRWALDVAGPFPVANGGDRYVVAAVEYVTRYVVASCVTEHTAETLATFIMQEIVLKFGVFRELLTDGAPEMTGKVIEELVQLLQAQQINPVPYRPQLVGLVERFHRTWKDCVSTFMQDEMQRDWNLWVKFAVYAYNSARHSTVFLTPNELMMGKKLRAPNELLRRAEVAEAGDLPTYHASLMEAMNRSHEVAEAARAREQERQAKYYNRKTRKRREFQVGDLVWVHNPPRGKKATKFVHQWQGPLRIIEPAGYDNFVLRREDKKGKVETVIAHVSFLVSYHYPEPLLTQVARDIDEELRYEDQWQTGDESPTTAAVLTATPPIARATQQGASKRSRTTVDDAVGPDDERGLLVERRRRRRRNTAGQYILEYDLYPCGNPNQWKTGDGQLWLDDGRARARWTSVA
ncbi:Gag-pol fusion protein, partial [Phytophthora megakarya]